MQALGKRPARFSLRLLLGVVATAAALSTMIGYGWRRIDQQLSERKINNLKSVVLSLYSYHDVHDIFPPSHGRDAAGKPFQSWRVEVVHFVEGRKYWSEYRPYEPWNSPNNDAFCRSASIRHLFRVNVFKNSEDSMMTQIVMPVGKGTIGERPVAFDDITDDPKRTIILLSLQQTDILWHEPRDLSITEFTRAADNPQRIMLQGRPFAGCHCAFADGSIAWLPADLEYDTLMALLTIAGGEDVDLSWR